MLDTWAAQRDSIRNEIGKLSVELEDKQKTNISEGLNLADLHKSIADARGRLAELDALEERHRTSVATDVATLEARKSRLESECTAKEAELAVHDTRIAEKVAAIDTLSKVHDKMADQANIVDQVVGQVIQTSNEHIVKTKQAMSEIEAIHTSVLAKSNENLAQANIIIEKMPKFIFDMQKPIPVRRTYPVGHPKYDPTQVTTP